MPDVDVAVGEAVLPQLLPGFRDAGLPVFFVVFRLEQALDQAGQAADPQGRPLGGGHGLDEGIELLRVQAQRVVRGQLQKIFAQQLPLGIDHRRLLHGLLVLVVEQGVVLDDPLLCLLVDVLAHESVGGHGVDILGQEAVRILLQQLRHAAVLVQALVAEVRAVLVVEGLGLVIGRPEFPDLPEELQGQVLIPGVVLDALGGGGVGINGFHGAGLGAVHPGGALLVVIGDGIAQGADDDAQDLGVAPLDVLFKEGHVRLVQQVAAQQVVAAVGLTAVQIEHVQGVVGGSRVGAARVIEAVHLIDQLHDVRRLIRKLPEVLFQKFRVGHVPVVGLLHVQQGQVGDGVAGVCGGLVAQVGMGLVGVGHDVLRAEGVALGLAGGPARRLGDGVEQLDLADVQRIEGLVLLRHGLQVPGLGVEEGAEDQHKGDDPCRKLMHLPSPPSAFFSFGQFR